MFSRSSHHSAWLTKSTLVLASMLLALPNAVLSAQDDQAADFDSRLQRLEKLIEAERTKNHIPGLALAVVKDGKVVLAKGFGQSNLEFNTAVDENTLFAIGSSTKSFTSSLVAMLVAEGKMDWDDPVTKYLPDFKMDIDTGDKQITIRDLLCHRTGFTRMGLIWASGSKTRSEVITHAAGAKPYDDFQKTFLYNNVMYMSAGVCAGQAMDSTWDELIAERIFQPLGMTSSSTSINVAQKDKRLSLGYKWDEHDQDYVQLPMRNLDSIGPSGSINSNVSDMAKWIQFQLADGKLDGKELLEKSARDETWSPQIEIGGGIDYGMGWMLREWNGKKVVEHGGNIDGFAAQVTLLPELNAGYVLLANVTATSLQGSSVGLVFDTLFGEAPSDEDGTTNIDTTEFLGNYIANFGPFDNATMEVKLVEGKLAIDVPGQMAYELKDPDKDGKWYFAVTDQIAVEFNRDDNDKVISVTMHQGGATPEFIREDFEPKPDLPLDEMAPLLGKYHDDDSDATINLEVRKGRLTIDTDGQGVFVFAPPEEGKDKWTLRASSKMIQVRFNKDTDGGIESLTRFQGGKETVLTRVKDSDAVKVPSVEKLVEKMKAAVGQLDNETTGIRLTGKANFIHQGVQGTYSDMFAANGRRATIQDFGPMAKIVEVYDGENAFSDSTISQKQTLHGEILATAKFRNPIWISLDWNEVYTEVQITGKRNVDDISTFEITFSGQDVADRKVYVDPESGFILRERVPLPNDLVPGLTATASYRDYRKVGPVMVPFQSSVENPMMGEFEITIETGELVSELPSDAFELPQLEK